MIAAARTGGAASAARRRRDLVTPEGLALPLTVASRASRVAALTIDLVLITLCLSLLGTILLVLGIVGLDVDSLGDSPAMELILVSALLLVFLSRYGYFLWFELGPRGATPGKRALGIRVAARGGARLTAEAVIARNLMRDAEVFVPLIFLIGSEAQGVSGIATIIWLGVFALFFCFNRDALRAGDLVAGTWVVEAERRALPQALSLISNAPVSYRFGEAELSVYGEHELQVLETLLRKGDPEALRTVSQAICGKIGWTAGEGDERAFLEAFYQALRERLERDMRFGRRKKDKFDSRTS
jgi:uncharacterized RDD family membrane protein YckC